MITFPARRLLADAPEYQIRVPTVYLSNATGIEMKNEPAINDQKADFVVLFVGRLHPEQNVSYLVKAFAEFRKEATCGELWILGEGHLKKELMKEVASLGISRYVKFCGWVPCHEVGAYYAKASLFVLPSWVETQGMVALEGIRYSLPILLSRVLVSAEDLVEDGVNGFLIDPSAPEELTKNFRLSLEMRFLVNA